MEKSDSYTVALQWLFADIGACWVRGSAKRCTSPRVSNRL